MNYSETICSLATSTGGAIGIIRVSGINAFEIVDLIFRCNKDKFSLKKVKPNTIQYGMILDGETLIDQVLVSCFKSPYSYTGEDVVEINFHGSNYIAQKILTLLLQNGAVSSKPGEFTQRAFLNGKMDLSQAEAVADLIATQSEMAHKIAIKQLKGGITNTIKSLRIELINFASLMELELDFGEEDVEFADRKKFVELIELLISKVEKLHSSFILGNAIKNGVPVAIAGHPNVGKSTLLNTLINEERAIVSAQPGTTRDTIEEIITLKGIKFRLIDTAGIRETNDEIEKEGIGRTYKKINEARIIICLFDAENINEENANQFLNDINYFCNDTINLLKPEYVFIINKIDKINGKVNIPQIIYQNKNLIEISAKKQINIDKLKEILFKITIGDISIENEIIISNARQAENLLKSLNYLKNALNALNNGLTTDLVNIDIRSAIHYLGEITGTISTENLLENIFANFCIGK
ncbi:MAG: tRNA uridine-5-carboxymethylaminomethyl(34) synthesis GTPase MnmE [Bacteroidetes bacterium GWE2_29_8]|nr:MAG: tRNA uridine-5-carboxymethylaminomethyl(34) synthesis GTPase MnmE [Bacteroidetes bacterium GWE2_29_8]OFY24829.1 MAG: tRNA uridine-5-carboxymethylaminomethyl(34) synthesis GTPase MnmE [Bacteroidetes bacterium GWF2_29_10]